MNPAQLLAHFDRISDAPDAIPRLRRFILDLAVRGKLVEQDPRDEPACELFKRIQTEKARLAQAGEIKMGKPLPDIEEDESPFQIPTSWRWVRLNDITSYIQRGKSPKYATGEGLPVISQKCVQWGGLELESAKLITRDSIKEYEPIRFLRNGDLLWNSTGTGTIGRIIKVKEPSPKLVCDSHVTVVRCLEIDAEYVRSWLRSDHVYAVIEDRAAGSTNQVELTSQLAMNQSVPLPPLAEQQRIVAKVDELMALCDRFETAQAERENRRDRLAASSLHRLNNGADADTFRSHARFYFNHLPRLTTRAEHIQQLRHTILNLAVRGKLVPQDPNDEPASELLNRIQSEKERFTKDGSLRKEKPLPPVTEGAVPFSIPTSWSWARIGTCSLLTEYGTSVKSDNAEKGVPVLKMADIQGGQLILGGQKKVPRQIEDLPQLFLKRFDLLYNRTNSAELVGKTGIYLGEDDAYTFASYLIRIRFINALMSPVYSNLAMNSPYFRVTQILPELQQQCGQANVNGTKLRNMMIPIPPLAEQHRIVAKVDELMALCDRLEAQLTTTQTESRRLLEAVLHETLAPAV